MTLFSLKLVAGLREDPADKQKCTADSYVEQIEHLKLLRFFKNYFVTGMTQRPRQHFLGRRPPPSLAAANDHDGAGFQDRGQRFEAIAAQKNLYARLYRTFACHHPKAILVELHKDRRSFEGERVRHHLRYHKRDPRAQAVRQIARFL